ncbi:sulfotransferase [Pleurocapsales cyanobacterium LEGE 10410]|nr:sulfotransferase [Pleurocapsales cyanobacterium LEGE 10410]
MTIKFVICGLEHSGTTLISDIFRQTNNVDSGFEIGVLLGKSPRDFPQIQPFYKHMVSGWQIESDTLKKICDTDSFSNFYAQLKLNSKAISPKVDCIFDKTPRYFLDVYKNYEKVKVPFICMYKDPRSVVYSDYKRSGKPEDFISWYENYKTPKIGYLKDVYTNSYIKWKERESQSFNNTKDIMCVSLENVCLNTRETMEKIFNHVGYEFDIKYLMLENLKYENTRQPQISSRIPFEYLNGFNKEQNALIEQDFALLEDWFYA